MSSPVYVASRPARSLFVTVRGLRYHLLAWGDPALATPERPPLVLLHGWMDVAASFQFMVDALADDRYVIAADWRGFGLSDSGGGDSYWFPDYLGDLDALLEHPELGLAGQPVDLLGHSMGGNVVMIYAGVRPERIRRLINLEGFGMPQTVPAQAPKRYRQWLDELREPAELRRYASVAEVAARLRKTNPLLPEDKAAWLAPHWSRQGADGQWEILGDPAHKRTNPMLYRVDEVLACWKQVRAPLLWVDGDRTDIEKWWGHRYPRSEFDERLAAVAQVERHRLSPAGHMLHHDQPEALARRIESFLA
ncbi:alpha/beta hydrolase [Rhizobacter sp. AJA081-3]|uniref:alpha/beta fold hydrolase n=1 Tax=Rhizobacter sp. AJA081-3 TaxID=2753607 RepID=UPI001ADF5203|nr:alpha/beta hydrolase [Rhizobacter sp. AJA081-3]QTN21741.1 alpha/beta hydrolase [Rhizobacter sp. AJA081-3]